MSTASADPVGDLVALAYERGHALDRRRAQALYDRFGYAQACEHVVMPARLVDLAATELRRRLSFDAACRLFTEAQGDFVAACRLMPSRTAAAAGGRPRMTPSELRSLAAEHGLRLSNSSARRYASDSSREPRDRIRSLGQIRDAGSRNGVRVNLRSAASRLAAAESDVELAVGRIERRARRTRLLNARLCRVRSRTGSSSYRVDVAAWCACSGCYQRLGDELAAYSVGVVRRRHQRMDDDLRQVAAIALLDALFDWQGGSGFKRYYGGVLARRVDGTLRRELAEVDEHGRAPLSLDAPPRSAERLHSTWVDRLPAHSIDPLDRYLLKERVVLRRRARRHEIERVLLLYEVGKPFA